MRVPCAPSAFLTALLGGLGLLITGGCYIDHAAVKENELPAEWRAALQDRAGTPEAFAGVYENIGQQWTRWMNRPGEGPRRIRTFFWLALSENTRTTNPARTFELVVVSPTQLKFIVREKGSVLNEEIRKVEWDASKRAFVYGKDAGIGLPGAQGPTVGWQGSHLYKGSDGNLYQQSFSGEVGPSVWVLPVSITSGDWSQWKPAASPAPNRR